MGKNHLVSAVRTHADLNLRIVDPMLQAQFGMIDLNKDHKIDLQDFPLQRGESFKARKERMYDVIGGTLKISGYFYPRDENKFSNGLLNTFRWFDSRHKTLTDFRSAKNPADKLVQVGVLGNLLSGALGGTVSLNKIFTKGGIPVGLGTFQGGDGEMVVDQKIKRVPFDQQTVSVVPQSTKVPFGVIKPNFKADKELVIGGGKKDRFLDLQKLYGRLQKEIKDQNQFYVFRLEGNFWYMETRSIQKSGLPYRPLTEAIKGEHRSSNEQIHGTLVVVWTPKGLGNPEGGPVSAPGFHAHFVPKDKKRAGGGHVYNLKTDPTKPLKVEMDVTRQLEIVL